jgi:hypothetical protein
MKNVCQLVGTRISSLLRYKSKLVCIATLLTSSTAIGKSSWPPVGLARVGGYPLTSWSI